MSRSLSRDASSERAGPRFLYKSVLEQLRNRIADGKTPDGEKLPTLKTLAEELAVSTMTIRRAIRTLETEGHVRHISGVGTFIRRDPRLPPVAQRFLAFVGAHMHGTFQMSVARGVQKACRQHRWAVQLLDAHWDSQVEAENVKYLAESGVKGAIVLPPFADPQTVRSLFEIQSSRCPIVMVDSEVPGLRADLVTSDHESGAYQATTYLASRGHRQILLVTHPTSSSSLAARLAGYQRGLVSMGISPRPEWIAWIDQATHETGYREGRKWLGGCQAILSSLRQVKLPVAVLAIDEYSGWGVYQACQELNLRIPEDVSVVAFDDSEVAHVLRPPMTVISQRTDEIGRTALCLLEHRIEALHIEDSQPMRIANDQPTEFKHVFVKVDLVDRGSVAQVVNGDG